MVYILLADGFEEIEVITPADIMRRAGIDVKTASISEKTVTGAHGIQITADILISEINPDDAELIMLPGGEGHERLDASNDVHAIINYAVTHDLYIAAICAAPSILGKKMLLEGKNATCYPGFEKYLYGANVSPDKAVIDGKIIMGKGPGAASEFGFAIVETLKGKDAAGSLKKAMQYE